MSDTPDSTARPDMTLREWYAGQALIGIIANPNGPCFVGAQDVASGVARIACEIADAIIKEGEER